LTTAAALHDDADLDFVVAPIAGTNRRPTWRLTSRHALSVSPWSTAQPARALFAASTATGRRLVDWDTTQLAPPERDLWLLTTEPLILTADTPSAEQNHELLARYTAATGRPVSPTALALYRLWWTLADIVVYTSDLGRPHAPGGDAAAALTHLASYLPPD